MSSRFHETRWTLVARSKGENSTGRAALSELCDAYYKPVVTFLQHDGRSEDIARDLAHDFFAKLLAGGAIAGADPMRGRFRTYLLMALKRFAADQRAKAGAEKRGGGSCHTAIEPGLLIADQNAAAPDAAFDREWALTLLGLAMASLEKDLEECGKSQHFLVLKPWLTGDADPPSQVDSAEKLGISPGAVKVAIHRLRKRFRHAVKAEIAHTVKEPGSVEDELNALLAALRHRG